MEFVVVAVLVVLGFLGVARPYIGLLALLIVMELQPGELYPSLAPFHLERIVAGIVLLAFFLHGEKWRFPVPIKWFLAFYGAMILSIPLAFWKTGAVLSCLSFLEIVVYVMLATALLTTESRIRWFVLTFVLLVDWLGGSALYNYHHGIWQYRMHIERAIGITSSAGDPNTMATTLITTMPLAISLMASSNARWMRWIGLGSIAMGMVTVVDTGSRSGALGVVFLILLLMIRKPKSLILLPLVVVLSPVVWMVIPQQYKARYETLGHLSQDDSYQNRIRSWEGGIAMFESNPITGIGAGDYTAANGTEYWPGTGRKIWLNAHSLYFKVLGELGLLGIFTFGGYVICVIRLNGKLRKILIEQNASQFLQILPSMLSIIFLQLLFAGYGSHDLYRSTWFIAGAMTASLSLLPVLRQPVTVDGDEQSAAVGQAINSEEWCPALLPVLRKQIPIQGPPA